MRKRIAELVEPKMPSEEAFSKLSEEEARNRFNLWVTDYRVYLEDRKKIWRRDRPLMKLCAILRGLKKGYIRGARMWLGLEDKPMTVECFSWCPHGEWAAASFSEFPQLIGEERDFLNLG